mmetsp:Transcript_24464/g.39159  ORF Transcript_24464/g.39159 Transcript_24464/m.39159 type:complete len:207 (+) Transcript_24464:64-684(+)|eukprot:CAMPEP_0169073208 /NCGR_PEP_ID=MMETSP1015-20121227/6618_1 /TAXON_ID=342587 /ORGANISM="Karlodinium micrum, Strain CCMP2283" /LENGTH=206 /DNA_ID=CAMNT_0009132441 /DNA_START=64 /DNA_END=684 /DNA_ORIENTATION=+
MQKDQHAAFTSLPKLTASLGGGNSTRAAVAQLSLRPELLADPISSPDPGATAKKAFDFAREVLLENEKWNQRQEEEKNERQKRADLLNALLPDSPANRQTASTPSTATPVSAVAKAAPTPSDKIFMIFTFPGGKQVPSTFTPSQSGFELYSKAFEMGGQAEPSEMKLTGPRGASSLNKVVTPEDWGSSLTDMGMISGKTYDLHVKH